MKKLTEKQQNILTFIDEFESREHMGPTVYEIADHAGIKTSTVFAHVRALQRKGKLTRTSQARSIKLIDAPQHKTAGCHTAVLPLEDASGQTGERAVDRQLFGSGNHEFFALKVSDDAMRNFGIFPGDAVIVRQIWEFNPGDIVVATVDDKNQIRSAYPKPQGKIELLPANSKFKTQVFPAAEITVRDVVVALQREY